MPTPAATTFKSVTRVPFLVADSFVLALDDFMRRTQQGGHVSQSVIELSGPPDRERLLAGLRRVVAKFPLLTALARRDWRTCLPYWDVRPVPPEAGLPFGWWREGEIAPGQPFADAMPTADVWKLVQWLSNEPLVVAGTEYNARVDALAYGDGRFCLILTWSHLLFDGKGAELFCAELARLCDGIDAAEEPAKSPPPRPRLSVLAKFRRTKPAMNYQTGLQETGVPSLGGPKPRPGNPNYQILTFDAADSTAIRTRAERLGGGLFPITFFVAAWRAPTTGFFVTVDNARRLRDQCPDADAQARRERTDVSQPCGAAVFQSSPRAPRLRRGNRHRDEGAVRGHGADKSRRLVRCRARLDAASAKPDFMAVIRAQFRGELCTCYSSHTGPFAPEMQTFAGARVTNAYHLPCLGTPPGTGIFFGEHGERINVTITWRDGALTDEERALMVTQLHDDLFGGGSTEAAA